MPRGVYIRTEQTKENIRLSKLGEKNPNFGKPKSQEFKDTLSKRFKGKPMWTEEQRKKIGERQLGKQVSQETRLKLSKALKGRKLTPEHIKKTADGNRGIKRSAEFKQNVGLRSKGNKYRLGKKHTDETKEKIRLIKTGVPLSLETRKKLSLIRSGEKHWNWQGGITNIYKKLRNSLEYKEWRKAVFERDNYTCQECKKKSSKGVKVVLHPHHIKSFSKHPELRFDINNGKTLCIDCHKKTDNFCGRCNKKQL